MKAAYGAWRSPITTQLITAGSLKLGAVRCCENGYVYWNESRPLEAGRSVLVRSKITATGEVEAPPKDITPPDFNARTTVHEYGGGEYCVAADETLFFSNFTDQRIYRQKLGATEVTPPEAVTPADVPLRFADFIMDAPRRRLIAVVEDHTEDEPSKVVNYIGAVSLDNGSVQVLVEGDDFYSSPKLSNDGQKLAFVSWNHPMMPWDSTELTVCDLSVTEGTVVSTRSVAGGKGDVVQSVMAPLFSPIDGKLYFTTDKSGWWSIWRDNLDSVEDGSQEQQQCELVGEHKEAEFGGPAWRLGEQPYVFLPDGKLLCTFGDQLGLLDPSTTPPVLQVVPTPPHSAHGNVAVGVIPSTGDILISMISGTSESPTGVKVMVVSSSQQLIEQMEHSSSSWSTVRASTDVVVDSKYLSVPEKIAFPTSNNKTAHMYYYPPTNDDYVMTTATTATTEKPPLLVKSHGGPTSSTSSAFNLSIQFWTSRGIAVADVNYGGSTGYGTEYRRRLTHPPSWGIVDVDDCSNAATFLANEGRVDQNRMAISGGSAGGFTTLACLAFKNIFSAGASHYGIGNLETLASDTHKFESRYLDCLVGAYPKDQDIYQQRSPINSVDSFNCPLIQFQGLEDKVVPPNQALEVFDALIKKNMTTACILFEGEQHGFRRAANIRRALDTELEFYGVVFGFQPELPMDHVSLVLDEKVVVPIEQHKL